MGCQISQYGSLRINSGYIFSHFGEMGCQMSQYGSLRLISGYIFRHFDKNNGLTDISIWFSEAKLWAFSVVQM